MAVRGKAGPKNGRTNQIRILRAWMDGLGKQTAVFLLRKVLGWRAFKLSVCYTTNTDTHRIRTGLMKMLAVLHRQSKAGRDEANGIFRTVT